MAVSLSAAFAPATASVLLTVAGSSWATVPAKVTITRRVPGGAGELVRGWINTETVGGYVVATDHEMPIDSSVTYSITGYSAAGAALESAQATISTAGAASGLWIKVPGRPDLTVRVGIAPGGVGEVVSQTVGGAYQILGGGTVAVAQYGGAAPWTQSLTVQALDAATVGRVRAILGNLSGSASRVLLFQLAGGDDVPGGWAFVAKVSESLLAQVAGGGGGRRWTLDLTAARTPAGTSAGAVWTYAALAATYSSYSAAKAANVSYFAMAQGPS